MNGKAPALDLLPIQELAETAEFLRVMAHPVRLRVTEILLQGEFPVGELAEMCELPPHQMSEHLRLMAGQRLLSAERRGRTVYYKIEHPRIPRLVRCIRESCML